MNNLEMQFFMLFGLLCVLAGVFGGRIHTLIVGILEMKRRRKVFPYLEKATEGNSCKGPHSYDRSKLAMPPLPVGEYLVCKDCGFVSNDVGSYRLNAPAQEVFHNNLKLRERAIQIDAELERRKRDRIHALMNQLIKANIEKFDGDMHKNIPELQQFFRKTAMELESVYAGLKKDLDELERG